MKRLWKRSRNALLTCLLVSLISYSFFVTPSHAADSVPGVDASLKPPEPSDDEAVATVFRDMGVVQRKAKKKSGKILSSNYLSMDFSDGPYSMYSLNTDLGVALSDFWEVYINFAPLFIHQKRTLTQKVENYTLSNGNHPEIKAGLAKMQYGVEILWAPLYGKDSLGLHTIIRSDTFFKVGYSIIQYDVGGNGMKFHLGIGKTYFLGSRAGFRVTVSGNYVQTVIDSAKSYNLMAMLEAGLVLYLF
jgi:hypothetical protein